ncbi:hypothetical protein FRC02_008309 [Tulasnella sp. 418]|nr:hypothetical protein FRC02_008309 [Tulasnella sp. 418]
MSRSAFRVVNPIPISKCEGVNVKSLVLITGVASCRATRGKRPMPAHHTLFSSVNADSSSPIGDMAAVWVAGIDVGAGLIDWIGGYGHLPAGAVDGFPADPAGTKVVVWAAVSCESRGEKAAKEDE